MKVAILTIVSFPEGLASTNRVFYHAKGLIDNNIEASVVVIKPTELIGNVKNSKFQGSYKGVPFLYSPGKTTRSSSFIRRRIDDFIGPIKGAIYVIKNKYDAVILSSNSFVHPMFFKILFRIFGIKFIVERVESMFHNQKIHGIYKIRKWIYEKIIYKNIDAFFAISYFLQDKYKLVVSKITPVHLIPVIVDDCDIYKPEIKRTRY
ncbi:MAG: hypothetical protein KAS62_12375, partial [Candidatus Delongbacteria bacterium]|nr:hypothetical protein [Candidatus Delongbacteria bacterium]